MYRHIIKIFLAHPNSSSYAAIAYRFIKCILSLFYCLTTFEHFLSKVLVTKWVGYVLVLKTSLYIFNALPVFIMSTVFSFLVLSTKGMCVYSTFCCCSTAF